MEEEEKKSKSKPQNKSSGKRQKVVFKEPNQVPSSGEKGLSSDTIKAIGAKRIHDSSLYWCMLAIVRVYLATVQTGYIHPDEFHQSLQVMAFDMLDIDAAKPWEFHTSSPIRSLAFLGVVSIPMYILKTLSPYVKYCFGFEILTPHNLIVFPRLFMTMISFVADFCIYRIASRCYVRPWQCLEVFAGSYIMLVYATRTFSNSVELVLEALLLWRVCSSIVDSAKVIRRENVLQDLFESVDTMKDKVKVTRIKNKLPAYNFVESLYISVIVSFGCFVRPTFIFYSFIPVAFWLQRGVITKELPFSYFNWRCLSLVPGAALVTSLLVVVDSLYYGSITFSELVFWNVTANSFTVTPLNFFLYNSNLTNLAQYGFHPYLWHIGVNIPLLYGVLGLIGLWSVSQYFSCIILRNFSRKPKVYSLATMLLFSFVVPILVLSLIPHQEPRFLLPSLVPLVLLNSDKVSIYAIQKFKFTKHFLFTMWQAWNIICVIFYGFLHQGGVTNSMVFLHDFISSQPPTSNFHIFFSHMYTPPTFLLMQKIPVFAINEDGKHYIVPKNVTTYDLGSSLSAQSIVDVLADAHNKHSDITSLLCITASMSKGVHRALPENASFTQIVRLSWHLSLENLPNLIISREELSPNCSETCMIKKRLQEFSVDIYAVKFNSTASSTVTSKVTADDPSFAHDEL